MLNFFLTGEIRASRAYTLLITIAPLIFAAALYVFIARQKSKEKANKDDEPQSL